MIIQSIVYIGSDFHITGNQFAIVIRQTIHALHFENYKIMDKLTMRYKQSIIW